LNLYLLGAQRRSFAYGEHDCCTFAAGAIEAMTGVDYMAEFRGRYDSVETGKEALKSIGHGSLLKTLYKKFGKPLSGAHGRKGDLAWYRGALGLVLGRQAIFLGREGIVLVRLSQLQRVFPVN
jgi:hypothetical protein